jgi:elongation factor P--beta-lysine ligase
VYCSSDKIRWLEKDNNGLTRRDKLFKRQRIIELIRSYYKACRFFEAEMPLLVSGTSPDAAIQSFEVQDKYLTTSTEYHIKRMIAGGFDKVFTLTKNFRKYEFGAYHNPEFTMLEWARAHASLETIENDAVNIITALCAEFYQNTEYLEYRNAKISLKTPWRTMSFQSVFYDYYGIAIPDDYDIAETAVLARRAGIEPDETALNNPGLLLSVLLDQAVKKMGFTAPVLIKKWPSAMTSSAETAPDSRWTERTEIIIAGIEIADGFPFLRDQARQKLFFERANQNRVDNNMPAVTYDERYLAMLESGLCAGAGMALGIDRLCMLFTDAVDIKDVLCFAWDEL